MLSEISSLSYGMEEVMEEEAEDVNVVVGERSVETDLRECRLLVCAIPSWCDDVVETACKEDPERGQ